MSLTNWFQSVRDRVRGLARRPSRRDTHRPPRAALRLERLEDRTVPSTVQGVVFEDVNGDGVRSGEPVLSGWTVFLDTDKDGNFDAGEPTTVTNSFGEYAFTTGIAPPSAWVELFVQVDQAGVPGRWVPTTPWAQRVAIPDNTTTGVADFGVQYHAYGAIVPVGGETLANVTTAGAQGGSDTAADVQGNFVVVWRTDAGNGTYDIVARRFNADGTAASGEFLVATSLVVADYTSPTPVVAMADNGTFAVAWETYNSANDNFTVFTRAYAANGMPLTSSAVQVTATSKSYSYQVGDIAMDADGDFVVLYKIAKKETFAGDTHWHYTNGGFQLYNKLGQAVGRNTQAFSSGWDTVQPVVAMDNNGNFVVVWSPGDILAQRYTSTGKKVGSQITVAATAALELNASVAMNGAGEFVVAWLEGNNGDVALSRRYSVTGTPQGGLIQIGSDTAGVGLALDDAGNAVFTWQSDLDPSRNFPGQVFFRRLTAGGVLEDVYVVNTTTQGFHHEPSVAFTGTDSFVISWSGFGAGDDDGVFFQRYGPTL